MLEDLKSAERHKTIHLVPRRSARCENTQEDDIDIDEEDCDDDGNRTRPV